MDPILPATCYHADEHYALENAALFAQTWVNTGSALRVANPGDALPLRVAGLPLVITRDEQGEIQAFHNVCRHRGARVLRRPCRGERLLRCAYHGWAYGMDGRLRGTPHWKVEDQSAPAGFEPGDFGLEPARVKVWLDQVFINLDGQAPPFEEFVAPLTERWANYDVERLQLGQQRELEVDANWKFVVENYLDTYHLPRVHPQLGDFESARRFTDVNLADTVFGICYLTGAADKPKSQAANLRRFERLNAAQQVGQDVLALFPNTLIELQPHHLMLVTIEPRAANRTREHLNFYYLDDRATEPALEPFRRQTADAWTEIMGQDFEVLCDLQIASRSPVADRVAGMSPVWEAATAAFRRRVAQMVEVHPGARAV